MLEIRKLPQIYIPVFPYDIHFLSLSILLTLPAL